MDVAAAKRELAEILTALAKGMETLGRDEFLRLDRRRSELSDFVSEQEYQALSFEERVGWWSAATYRHMRWQAESGLDQLLLFDQGWYEKARLKEPKIAEILALVCARLGIPFQLIQKLVEHELSSTQWKEIRSTVPETDYV